MEIVGDQMTAQEFAQIMSRVLRRSMTYSHIPRDTYAAAAGPKGRDAAAATDVTMRAEILSYSRARGLFAGVSLEGSTLRPDNGANKSLYGKEIPAKDIALKGAVPPPASAKLLLATLNKKSPKNISGR